jgi:hypothetical protein
MDKKLTAKQKLAAQNLIIHGMTKRQALLEAKYSKSYANKGGDTLWEMDAMKKYIADLELKKRKSEVRLWEEIISDAVMIYRKYKSLADGKDTPADVKRKIWSNILDRAGFQAVNKIDVNNTGEETDEQVEANIVGVIKDLQKEGIDVLKFFKDAQ